MKKTCTHCLRPFEEEHPLQTRCTRIDCRKVEGKLEKVEKKTLGRKRARLKEEKPKEAKARPTRRKAAPKEENPFTLSEDAIRRLGTRSEVPHVDPSLERTDIICLRCGVNHVPLLPWKGHVLTRLCEGCFMRNTREDYWTQTTLGDF